MRAQLAIEYVIVIGIILIALIPIFYYSLTESSRVTRINQANDAVNTLARAADGVYSIGPGTRKYVWINMPGGVRGYSLANKTVLINLFVFGGVSDVFSQAKADLAGVIPLSGGEHRIKVEMLETGYVLFGEANDSIAPVITWTSPRGTINYNGIILRATTNEYAVCKYDEDDVDYEEMEEDFVGSALTHEKDMGVLDSGNHVYYARCQDPGGNIMQESALINFTIVIVSGNETVTNETYEAEPPLVYLLNPPNLYVDSDGIVLFE